MGIRDLDSGNDRLVLAADVPALDPARAWDHWTDPALLTRWWPAEAENDPRLGGAYHLAWPSRGWHLRGRYTVWQPTGGLAFTWQWDHEPEQPLRHVAVDFAPRAEGGSVVTVTHAVYGDTTVEQEVRASHREGWMHFLERLAALKT